MPEQFTEGPRLTVLKPKEMVSLSHRDFQFPGNADSFAKYWYHENNTRRSWTLENSKAGDCYDIDLPDCDYPHVDSLNVQSLKPSNLVAALIEDRKHIAVADFGYGAGLALLEAINKEGWKGNIDHYAVGFSDLAKKYIRTTA